MNSSQLFYEIKIFTDLASGSIDCRKGMIDAIEFCRNGDSLIVWKLDRRGRSLRHLISAIKAGV
jgi:DNA invertase Pin-like site-specific DNA recombinase